MEIKGVEGNMGGVVLTGGGKVRSTKKPMASE